MDPFEVYAYWDSRTSPNLTLTNLTYIYTVYTVVHVFYFGTSAV